MNQILVYQMVKMSSKSFWYGLKGFSVGSIVGDRERTQHIKLAREESQEVSLRKIGYNSFNHYKILV